MYISVQNEQGRCKLCTWDELQRSWVKKVNEDSKSVFWCFYDQKKYSLNCDQKVTSYLHLKMTFLGVIMTKNWILHWYINFQFWSLFRTHLKCSKKSNIWREETSNTLLKELRNKFTIYTSKKFSAQKNFSCSEVAFHPILAM